MTQLYRDIVEECAERGERKLARLIEMFNGRLDPVSEVEIPAYFCLPDSPVRILISTVALGMGVQVQDVRHVVHWGPPSSVLAY